MKPIIDHTQGRGVLILIRWRLLISSLLHHLVLLAAILVFLWAVFLSILRIFFVFLPQHEAMIANILSPVVGAPVTFDKLDVDWHHLAPEFILHDVKILGAKHKVLMSVPEVSIRIDLFSSLVNRKPEIGLLQIQGWKIRVYQDTNNQWQVAGIEQLSMNTNAGDDQVGFNAFIGTMESIHHLQLSQNDIVIQSNHQPLIKLMGTNLDWYSNGQTLALYGNTFLQGPSNAKVHFSARLNGDSIKNLTGQVYLRFVDLNITPWLAGKAWKNFVLQQGTVGGEVWGEWNKDHWGNAATELTLDQPVVHQINQAKPWGLTAQKILLKLNGDFSDKKQQVSFEFESTPGKVNLGNIFRSAMSYEKLAFSGQWTNDGEDNNLLKVQPIHWVTADADTWSWFTLTWSKTIEPTMQLISTAHLVGLQNVSRNLPAGIMPNGVVSWLDNAILGGDASDAELFWRGPLGHFPFRDQSGTMQIYGKLNNVGLDYAPHWPTISQLSADLFFTSHGMHIVAQKGLMSNLSLANAVVDIPEFKAGGHLLIHHPQLQGDLSNAWQYLDHSPLKTTLSALVDQMTAQGPFSLNLNIDLPLANADAVKYQGVLDLKQDQLNLLTTPIHLTNLSGQLSFANQDFQSKNLQANWLDEVWHVQVSSSNSKIQLDFSGIAPVAAWVKQEFQWAASWVDGKAAVVGKIIFGSKDHTFNLQLNSSLQGVALHTPFGQNKSAETNAPLSVQLSKNNEAPLVFGLNLGLPQSPINARTQNGVWSINTPAVSGRVVEPSSEQDVWQVNLSHVDLQQFKSFDTSSMSTDHIPALDISAARLTLPSGMFFDSLQLQLRPQADGSLVIKNLALNQRAFQISAQGSQRAGTSSLKGQLTASDLEAASKALGLPNLAEATKTAADFDFSWPGSLWDFDRKILQGHLKISTSAGVFKDVSDQTLSKINLGRMLDILSVSELPSHLTSKFNDMTQKGFPFDQVKGEMDVTPDRISNMNIKISGPVADVALKGCLNTQSERLNLIAEVNPKLTGSLPLLATLAGGPILGAIGFVANEVLSPAVGKLSATYYAVTGNEKNPKTDKVNHLQSDQLLQECPV